MKCSYWLAVAVMMVAAASTWAQEGAPKRALFDTGGNPAITSTYEARMRQADNLCIEGQKALRKGETAQGVALLLQSLSVDAYESKPRTLLADVYIEQKRTADVLNILKPIIYPPRRMSFSEGRDVRTRMKYVLALLDTRQWTEAATLYEQSLGQSASERADNLRWTVPGYGGGGEKDHWLPDVHFSSNVEDIPGMRAQAHLILGTRWPMTDNNGENLLRDHQYMLDHIQQALKNNPRLVDAQFVSGVLLREMGRYDEARAAFARTAQMAPAEAQPEIKAAVDKLNRREEQQKADDAQQARKQAAQGKTSP